MAETRNHRTFAEVFDPRRNVLNAIRLLLALSVIAWHAVPLSGATLSFAPALQLFSHVGVDCFFAISGYLIVSSWMRRPRWRDFLRARVLRIFPAFWVCLIVTAAMFAPLSVVLRGADFPPGFLSDAVGYVGRNILLRMFEYDIAGTPADVPYPGVWDGALWTLFWEFLCYLGVLALGLVGLLRRRLTMPIVFLALEVGSLLFNLGVTHNYWIHYASQLGIMFAAGALVHQFRDRIPVTWPMLVGAAVVVLLACLLPDYRLVAALPLAYLVLSLGALGKQERLNFRNDLSYGSYIYGFPLAQLLATVGVTSLGVPAFAVLSIALTLPVAAASWFLVEKQAMRLRARRSSSRPEAASVEGGAGDGSVG